MFVVRFHVKLGKCLTAGKNPELLVPQHVSLSLFPNNLVMGSLLKETSRNLNMHIDSGLAQPQEQSWNRHVTDRSPEAELVFSICFFSPTQHWYLQYKYTTYSRKAAFNSSLLQKKKSKHVSISGICLLRYHCWPRQLLIRVIICSHWTKGFGHSFSCLLGTLNSADNKHPDCPWGNKFWLFKNTLAQWWSFSFTHSYPFGIASTQLQGWSTAGLFSESKRGRGITLRLFKWVTGRTESLRKSLLVNQCPSFQLYLAVSKDVVFSLPVMEIPSWGEDCAHS